MNTLTCYKYRRPSDALRCLREGTLYFAAPHQLNDTLEAQYDHASSENFTRLMTETFCEVSQQRGGSALTYDQHNIAEIMAANRRESLRFQSFTERTGIFSAANRPDHQAMWAYYADDASGVCFELEWSHDILNRHQLWPVHVHYQNASRLHNRAQDWRTAFLELAQTYPDASLEELHQLSLDESVRRQWGIRAVARAVSVKHTDWAHEQEIRLLAPKSGILGVLAAVLKRVHFIRPDAEHWEAIMQCLHTDYPSVEVVHWQFSHGRLGAIHRLMEFRRVPIRQ